jgi:hypothetical protein
MRDDGNDNVYVTMETKPVYIRRINFHRKLVKLYMWHSKINVILKLTEIMSQYLVLKINTL